MKKYYTIALLLIVLSNCQSDKIVRKTINEDFYEAIKEYVQSEKEYDQFLLIPADKFPTVRDDISGYLIGPLYPIVLELMETDVLEFVRFTPNQSIYYTTEFKELFEENKPSFKTIKDSVVLYKGHDGVDHYDRNPLVNFLKRARLLQMKDKLIINYQPDTLFLPKIVEDETVWEAPPLECKDPPML